jgi:tripartite-type tricarboxylate transporter receptor subunit TctC
MKLESKLHRRKFLHLAAGSAVLPTLSGIADAQAWPTRPVRIISGYPPGIAPDVTNRIVAQALSERFDYQVFVENRLGASSNLAAETVVRSAPDGYTLLGITVTNTVNSTLYAKLNFDFVRDIEPIVGYFRSPNVVVVTPSFPAKDLREFIAYLKANPGKVNYASNGPGSMPQITCELFKMMAGVQLVHVPYRASYMPDLLSGQIQVAFNSPVTTMGSIQAGQLRALAVTSSKRLEALPDVPTVGEIVPGYEAYVWHGLGGPKGISTGIVDKLNKDVNALIANPQIIKRFAELGGEPLGGSPADFGRHIAAETEKWGKVIRAAGLSVE